MSKLIDPYKAQVFVRHVQNHLDKNESNSFYSENRRIPIGMVGCKICERGIDEIYNREKDLVE